MADLKDMKNVSDRDRKLIEDAEALIGPEPETMGAVKNLFWGNFREELYFSYPEINAEETARCDQLLAELNDYLKNEHPAVQIDQEQEIPEWAMKRLFEIGPMGMNIPIEYGGGGYGITSYNRALEAIGGRCGSSAVVVSAHQSIGCKALVLFGTEEQKKKYLPHLANDWPSAFCLSEPNVGCDAGGQETMCELSEDGTHYIVNGEKKWATSGALSGVFTVMAKQKLKDPKTGKIKEKVTALICTPDLEGIDIYQKNRSKCGIRGTWQARIRFTDAKVPVENRLHDEGKGLNVALTCLNYGRCTLSAGMLGGAKTAAAQAIKWAQTRYQFERPLADFELVKQLIARMEALNYASDAVLYMTTGMLDRHDEDIMLETAICKIFCSETGWTVVNAAMQIMGGESYMTENEVERIFRDSRINLIVEGANEVMQSFVFAYGGKQLAENMLDIQEAIPSKIFKPTVLRAAIPLALELFLGIRKRRPKITKVHDSLRSHADRLAKLVQEHSHQFKQASKRYEEKIIDRQAVQARLADNAMWIHAFACTLSKLDRDIRKGDSSEEFQRDKTAGLHFLDMAERAVEKNFADLYRNTDDSMLTAAEAALKFSETLPNSDYYIPEGSPNAKGTGKVPGQDGIKQFPGDAYVKAEQGAAR